MKINLTKLEYPIIKELLKEEIAFCKSTTKNVARFQIYTQTLENLIKKIDDALIEIEHNTPEYRAMLCEKLEHIPRTKKGIRKCARCHQMV